MVVLNVIEQYQEISTPPNPNPKNLLLSPPPPFRDFYPWFDDVPMFHTKYIFLNTLNFKKKRLSRGENKSNHQCVFHM